MTAPVRADVDLATQDALLGLATGDLLQDLTAFRESELASTGLDARTFALVKIATLMALDAPPASYAWQVANALDAGATPQDLIGVLWAETDMLRRRRPLLRAAVVGASRMGDLDADEPGRDSDVADHHHSDDDAQRQGEPQQPPPPDDHGRQAGHRRGQH